MGLAKRKRSCKEEQAIALYREREAGKSTGEPRGAGHQSAR